MAAASLLRFPGRGPHHWPFLLTAAGADVLVSAQAADGVQVAAGVFRGSRGSTWRYGSHRRGQGADGGGGERWAEDVKTRKWGEITEQQL